jgi:hypothetical protein
MRTLLRKLWHDDDGSILATEYLMLGSIVALGSVSGLAAMRDATVAEMEDFGAAVHSINQSYNVAGMRNATASRAGSAYVDPGATANQGTSTGSLSLVP